MPHISVSCCHLVVSFVTTDNDWYLTEDWLDLGCIYDGSAKMNCDNYRCSCHLNFVWTADGLIRTSFRNWTQHCGLLAADPSNNTIGELVKQRQYADFLHSNCTNFRANRNADYTNYNCQHHYFVVLTVIIYIIIIWWHNGMCTLKMQKCTDMVHGWQLTVLYSQMHQVI